jgi:hypothetical protein
MDYEQQLSQKLQSARTRVKQGREFKALKASAPSLFEIIDTEVSLILNRAFGEKPLDYDAYLSAHGEMKGIKRIRNLIDSKEAEEVQAAQEVQAIEGQLKQFQDDKKQQ